MYKTNRALLTIGLATATFFGGSSLATMQDNRGNTNQTNQNNSAQNGNGNRRTNTNRGNGSNGNMSGGNMSNGNMSGGSMMNAGDTGSGGGGMMMAMMGGGSLTATDNEFARMAAMGGQAEIQMAQLAVQRSTNDDVRDYAQRMIKDHTKNARDLQKAATRSGNNVALPTAPSAEMMQMMAPLQQASGAEFDRLYMQMAGVQAHTMMRQLYTNQASNGTNNDLKRYAQKTIPVIDKHLRMAQEVNLNEGSGGSSGGATNRNSNRNTNTGGNSNTNNNNR